MRADKAARRRARQKKLVEILGTQYLHCSLSSSPIMTMTLMTMMVMMMTMTGEGICLVEVTHLRREYE